MPTIQINGEEEALGVSTVAELVAEKSDMPAGRGLAVALNGTLVRRADWAATSLKAGDALGGHLVSGHIDGVATITSISGDARSQRLRISVPSDLARYIARKGSVAVDGVSLTVNEVDGNEFGVNIIPHTQTVTTLGRLAVGARVNLEIDQVARYVERLLLGSSTIL